MQLNITINMPTTDFAEWSDEVKRILLGTAVDLPLTAGIGYICELKDLDGGKVGLLQIKEDDSELIASCKKAIAALEVVETSSCKSLSLLFDSV